MKTIFPFIAALVAMALGCSPEFTMDQELQSLVETERAFSRHSVENGMRDAFLTYLAEESIVFEPGPVDGRKVHQGREETSGTLIWWPVWAEIASGGDMGYTTGPWEFRRIVEGDTAVGYGHYVSVWRKQPDGAWRVAIDAGNAYARPEVVRRKLAVPDYHRPVLKPLDEGAVAASRAALLQAERDLSELSATRDAAEAFCGHTTEDVRLYRTGIYPAVGKETLRRMLSGIEGRLSWEPIEAVISATADLGYTYGISRIEPEGEQGAAAEFSYLRIWKRQPDGPWKVCLDLANPMGNE
jgi:ketosteroid isomerase-like protein